MPTFDQAGLGEKRMQPVEKILNLQLQVLFLPSSSSCHNAIVNVVILSPKNYCLLLLHVCFQFSKCLGVGQGTSEGKRAYHCNYCNKDITGKIRIKCCMCPDFDLCIECFSVGAEVTSHKSNHPYRVMVSIKNPPSFFLHLV